jgi:hypothetical protein
LDVVHEFRQAPVRVGFHVHQRSRFQRGHVAAQHGRDAGARRRVLLRRDEQQRGQQVVHALHVPRGRVPDGPNVQNTFHRPLDLGLLEKGHVGARAGQVDLDLPQRLPFLRRAVVV